MRISRTKIFAFNFVTAFFVSIAFWTTATAENPAILPAILPDGISKTKPSTGPFVEIVGGFMVPYSAKIPGTEVAFEMIPVAGGTVKLGTPADEAGRSDDEGPQASVKIDPIWVGKTELTWGEYKTYMGLYKIFKNPQKMSGIRKVNSSNRVDAITAPTPLYMPTHTFEYGEDPQQPAVTMTQYAAKQYTKWLSGMTGLQYRLPTEAEWEYAARGNTTSAYSFGMDASELENYASFDINSPDGAAAVGSKKPNPFGLHDIHGNVWEWTVDGYSENGFAKLGDGVKTMEEAIQWPTKADSRVVRGGGWQDPADRCRSGSRMSSQDEDWKGEDPNSPLSPWWYTTDPARSVGMRLVRSATPLPKELITKFWEYDHEDIESDVEFRIQEGRGALGLPTPQLAEDIKEYQ